MFLLSCLLRAPVRGSRRGATTLHVTQTHLSMLDIFVQIQLGISIPLNIQRGFLLQNCSAELEKKGFDDPNKLAALDGKLLHQLLKEITLKEYLNCVPFKVFGFDMEFTGPPVFRSDGPTEDIIELGAYSPSRNETFSCLVHPYGGRKVKEEVIKLTGISNEMIRKDGLPFPKAWKKLVDFLLTPEKMEGVEEKEEDVGMRKRNTQSEIPHILLLSHGGKLADQSLIKYTLEKTGIPLPEGVVFGDTIHIIRDAHRRRPVTVDRHPPAWGLSDLVSWLNIPPTLPSHRAGNDAKMTWDILYHTLLRYGDDTMTPKQQLVSRFFDEEAKKSMKEIKSGEMQGMEKEGPGELVVDNGFFSMGGKSTGGRRQRAGTGSASSSSSSRFLSEAETESLLLDTDFDSIFAESALTQEPSSLEDSGDELETDTKSGGERRLEGEQPFPESRTEKTKRNNNNNKKR